MATRALGLFAVLLLWTSTTRAGPPYFTDDPVPTDAGHFEVYGFGAGTSTRAGRNGAVGLDVSYGAAENLQISMTLPMAYDHPRGGTTFGGLGNVEIAAKYRFLRQDDVGVDVAVFPRVFLPSTSHRIGEQHATFFLPLWLGREWENWSTFGGGGCAFNRGHDAKDFCVLGAAVTRQLLPNVQIGVEIYHQTPSMRGDRASTALGFGARYDVTETLHFVAALGPGVQHAADTGQLSWYAALLFTF